MPKKYKGEMRYSSSILDLGTNWWLVVNFKHQPLYPGGKSPPVPTGYAFYTPMDFFQWGYLKECVHAVPPRTITGLVARLQAAVTTVDTNVYFICGVR
jgi:hypothetical protein